MTIQNTLNVCHGYLMKQGFSYHSVSVIHRSQDLGFHVIFSNEVKTKITPQIKRALKNLEFTYSIVQSKPKSNAKNS